MSLAYPDKNNPFFNDDDDDIGFGSRGGGGGRYGGGFREVSDDEFGKPVPTKAEQLQQMKEQSMQRQLESTKRALASIEDSERMGVATAEELIRQGEQLDNIETKTDTINQDMKTSQRHLNGIKSVFGGIKNWWSSKKPEPVQEDTNSCARSSNLKDTLDAQREAGPHPGLRIRSENLQGFYEDSPSSGSSSGGYTQQTCQTTKQGSSRYDQHFDENLDMMSNGMQRLRGLALGLGEEIEAQNEQVDRINDKASRADITIQDQNKQMRGILGIRK